MALKSQRQFLFFLLIINDFRVFTFTIWIQSKFNLKLAAQPAASRLYFLFCPTSFSTSFMKRRQSSSCHGRATHCTPTGRPSPPDTAWTQTQDPVSYQHNHSLLPPPTDQLWHYWFNSWNGLTLKTGLKHKTGPWNLAGLLVSWIDYMMKVEQAA